jgi:GMP synthase-like glutamine amidotransferase
MLKALTIAHHHDYNPGLIGEAFESRGYELTMIAREDLTAGNLPEPLDYDVIIPFGSAWSVISDHADQVAAEQELLRGAHDSEVAIFGVCFGGQQLAAALGGRVQRAETPEIGWYSVQSEHSALAGPWMQFHLDEIVPPPASRVLATTTCVQAFRVDRSLGLQFHPEVNREIIEEWLEAGGTDYLPPLGLTAEQVLTQCDAHEPQARQRTQSLVDAFLRSLAGVH